VKKVRVERNSEKFCFGIMLVEKAEDLMAEHTGETNIIVIVTRMPWWPLMVY
jgi:hypothetical protein